MVVNTDNVADGGTLELLNLQAITTGVVDGVTLVFAGGNDDGISVFRLEADNTLTALFDLNDDASLELADLRELEFVTIGGNPILVAAGNDDGLSTFDVQSDGTLTLLDELVDNGARLMGNINAMTTYTIGGTTFAVTGNSAGSAQEGITTYSLASDGTITLLDQISDADDPTLLLNNLRDIEAVDVGGTTFLVGGGDDNGLTVFSVDAAGTLTNVEVVADADDAAFKLTAIEGLAIAQVGGSTFVYAAGHEAGAGSGGISVFELDATGQLTNVQNISEPDVDLELDLIQSVETIVGPSGETFLYIVGNDDTLQQFFIASDGTIDLNVSEPDDANSFLLNARDVALLVSDDQMIAIAGGLQDGVSVFTVPCFTPGAMIETPFGPRAVETLKAGDLVLTHDEGPVALRYVARRHLDAATLAAAPNLAPVVIRAGTLGAGLPRADLVVSPQHRMLVAGWRAQVLYGVAEALAPALALGTGAEEPGRVGATYFHLVFDRHHVVTANGAPTESFYPGPGALTGLEQPVRQEILTIFPGLAGGLARAGRSGKRAAAAAYGGPARPLLKAFEARLWCR